jgi:hypothetical protein
MGEFHTKTAGLNTYLKKKKGWKCLEKNGQNVVAVVVFAMFYLLSMHRREEWRAILL